MPRSACDLSSFDLSSSRRRVSDNSLSTQMLTRKGFDPYVAPCLCKLALARFRPKMPYGLRYSPSIS